MSVSKDRISNESNVDILEEKKEDFEKLFNDKNLVKVKEKVAYTLEINLIKEDDGNWKISNLSNEDIKKIQGMY